jgi:raffinose/stachyose/melibiose transport system permease protein
MEVKVSQKTVASKLAKKPIKKSRILIYILLSVTAIGQLFPLVWLVNFSLLKSGDLFGSYILKWPTEPQWKNYVTAWVDGKIPRYFLNSIIVNGVSVSSTILLAVTMAYAFTRMRWKLRNLTLTFVLLGMMIPIHATLLPNYILFGKLGISDSYAGLIIPYVAFALPLAVFIMTGFLESIPRAIEESAVIDGCGIFRIIFQIILPLLKPAVATVAIMTFLNTWNEFIMASTYLSDDKFRTLPFAVYNFAGQYASNYSVQFAVMTVVAVPSLIFYVIFNKQITKGVADGALKG